MHERGTANIQFQCLSEDENERERARFGSRTSVVGSTVRQATDTELLELSSDRECRMELTGLLEDRGPWWTGLFKLQTLRQAGIGCHRLLVYKRTKDVVPHNETVFCLRKMIDVC